MNKVYIFLNTIIYFISVFIISECLELNPYVVLDLKKDSSVELIRQRYKQLVKEW